jgi:WD40 repeat protein
VSLLLLSDHCVISAGFDGVVAAWSDSDIAKKWSEHVHTGSVTTLSAKGNKILTGGVDGEVRLLHKSGKSIAHGLKKVESIWKVAFISDRAIVCGRESGMTTLWTFVLSD